MFRSISIEAIVNIIEDVKRAIEEDLGDGDVTAQLIPADKKATAQVITREKMVLAGQAWFEQAFLILDPTIELNWQYKDGDSINANETIVFIKGNSRTILSAERTALNFLQLLSGTATKTRAYVDMISTHTVILDSRKTIPGLRHAQKYAVRCGGGQNHRLGLYDAYLIKENHIKACGSISLAVSRAKELYPQLSIEVEVENLVELKEAFETVADTIMLDNFSIELIKEAITMRSDRQVKLEASGNVNLDTIKSLSETGVDYISIGDLTKSVQAIDLSLMVDEHE